MGSKTKPIFAHFRRKVADWVLGSQTVLFTSRANIDRMECGDYLSLPDEVLGLATRRWFLVIEEAHRRHASSERRPVMAMTSQHAVLALATMAARANAETMDINIRGSIDGGKTERVFSLQFAFAEEHDFAEPGVYQETAPDDPDKITKLTIGYVSPTYDRWKAERAREKAA